MMDATATGRSRIVQLDWTDADGQATITPRDQDRFALKIGEVIKACQIIEESKRVEERFRFLLNILGRWLKSRSDVGSAFVTTSEGRLLFVAVRNQAPYSREFEDSLSDLDLAVANDVDLSCFRMDVLGLPPASRESIESFLNPNMVLEFDGR